EVVTKSKLNGGTRPDVIARTAGSLLYRPGAPAFALIDYDAKGMPPSVAARVAEFGGLWPALISVVPELATVTRIERASTSAGLYRTDTGDRFSGSGVCLIFIRILYY